MGGSFIKRSSISKLFRMVFSEEVIELFSIFIVISFFILFLTVKPEFSNLIASSSDRQTINISLTGESFFNNRSSFPSYDIDPSCTHITLLHNDVISFI